VTDHVCGKDVCWQDRVGLVCCWCGAVIAAVGANLFRWGDVTLHSGASSPFKIDTDALTGDDWQCLAHLVAELVGPFGAVEGVPRGGLPLATALSSMATAGALLIVDDVLTTGVSMEEHRAGREAIGAVVFCRSPSWPAWIEPLFLLNRRKFD
jgi:orotate phosphoribosyltransferase